MGEKAPDERLFVRIRAPVARLLELRRRPLDLIESTAVREKGESGSVEALLTPEQVERLREEGFEVEVQAQAGERARAHEVMDLEEWRRLVDEA